ncbi:DUF4430 domain-containing protein [Inediibacterium massiliense]|uniref:DUF4430 domain-containing protein n=1 Tax=Inediibacterium massiliense TaxID=1658111 RepID=UPI0006B5D8AA|nr:DUF4430 domain-containing protein [Inediibacterium massiliense]
MKKWCWMVLIILLITGCSSQSVDEGRIQVMVSKDFGKKVMHDQDIKLNRDKSVMEVMKENFQVETAYGGGFINGIDSLKSGFTGMENKTKLDWFYYVNGMISEVGADDYICEPGDVILWDYHDWSQKSISSIIGAYPQNFINGYNGQVLKTEISSTKEYEKDSKNLLQFLQGKKVEISRENINEDHLKNGEINSILIGLWDELSKLGTIKDYYENKDKVGLSFEVDSNIKLLDMNGKVAKEYKKGAWIVSISKEYGMSGTLWMISGNDQTSIQRAVKILYEEPEKIRGKFSVFVTEDEIINMPIK